MALIQILLGVLSLSLLVLAHEWGHFVLARRTGVAVERFAVFLGPPLWQKRQGETLYSLGVIPLGGYCKFRADLSARTPREGDFYAVSWQARLLVVLAGPFASVLLGMMLFWMMNLLPQPLPPHYSSRVVVFEKTGSETGKAFAAGLRDGDRIVSVNGNPVSDFSELTKLRDLNEPFRLEFQREGNVKHVDFAPLAGSYLGLAPWVEPRFQKVPRTLARQGVTVGDAVVRAGEREIDNTYRLAEAVRDGARKLRLQNGLTVTLSEEDLSSVLRDQPYFTAVAYGGGSTPWQAGAKTLTDTGHAFGLLWNGLAELLSGRSPVSESLLGPLRLSEFIGTSLTVGGHVLGKWLWVMALISINLAVVNLLPLPGLDGGAVFVTLLLLLLPRRCWSYGYRVYAWIGMLFLLGLLVVVLGLDLRHYLEAL